MRPRDRTLPDVLLFRKLGEKRRGDVEYGKYARDSPGWRTTIVVHLDLVLLHKTKRLITGANVHLASELILGYELAVSLHNAGFRSHMQYQDQYEKDLRKFAAGSGRKVA
jgi:hypothetical protein